MSYIPSDNAFINDIDVREKFYKQVHEPLVIAIIGAICLVAELALVLVVLAIGSLFSHGPMSSTMFYGTWIGDAALMTVTFSVFALFYIARGKKADELEKQIESGLELNNINSN